MYKKNKEENNITKLLKLSSLITSILFGLRVGWINLVNLFQFKNKK
jgi:hypothetical protein